MTLHFYAADIASLEPHGTSITFRYLPKGYMDEGHIRLEIDQDLMHLVDHERNQVIERAFSSALDIFRQTWQAEQRLPTEHAPYRETVDFTLTDQPGIHWHPYELTLDE